jgi:ribosomal protein S18 acetylase RimI-like enzyme
VIVRNAEPADYPSVIGVMDAWWGGRHLAPLLPRLFFEHFRYTSFVVEDDGELVAFFVGFLSQSRPEEAYIHFIGVHPDRRGSGIARDLYERFFAIARANGRSVIRCVTAPVNTGSIAFHRKMGFEIEPGNGEIDGVSVNRDHDGPGGDRVLFRRCI